MKIALLSKDVNTLQDLGRLVDVRSNVVVLIEGGRENLRAVAEREQPDLMLVDGIIGEAGELGPVEAVTSQHPKLAIVLVCASITPDFLISAMRAGVSEVLPAPAPAAALEAAINRIAAKLSSSHVAHQGRILAFMPCKGGSGATFLATNLGFLLAERKSVLLIDLNLQFGDALSFVHDAPPASTLADITQDIRRLDASFLDASAVRITHSYSILAAPADPAQSVGITPEHVDAILGLALTRYDFVLLDVPRNLDAVTLKALDRAHLILPVLQAGLPGLQHAKSLVTLFLSLGYSREKIALIINRFDRRAEIGIEDVRRLLGGISLRTIPNAYKEVNTAINHGNPLIEAVRSSPVVKSLMEFVHELAPEPKENGGLFARMFRKTAGTASAFGSSGTSGTSSFRA